MLISLGCVWQYQQHLQKGGLAGIYLHYDLLTCFRNFERSFYLPYLPQILVTQNYSPFPGHEFYVVQYCAGDNTSDPSALLFSYLTVAFTFGL